jgi:hypothetical protein
MHPSFPSNENSGGQHLSSSNSADHQMGFAQDEPKTNRSTNWEPRKISSYEAVLVEDFLLVAVPSTQSTASLCGLEVYRKVCPPSEVDVAEGGNPNLVELVFDLSARKRVRDQPDRTFEGHPLQVAIHGSRNRVTLSNTLVGGDCNSKHRAKRADRWHRFFHSAVGWFTIVGAVAGVFAVVVAIELAIRNS